MFKMKWLFSLLLLLSVNAFPQDFTEDLDLLLKSNPDYLTELEGRLVPEIIDDAILGQDGSVDGQTRLNEMESDEKSDIFGFDYIQSIPKSISTTSDLPIPNDYVLSLGDKLRIILTGGNKNSFVLTVGMDGSILFPELGIVNVFGDTLSEARRKIEDLVNVSYVGTEVSISLQELSAKKINILGAVKNPGTYIVNPFSTISSSLAYSGGFEDYASLRSVTLIRGDEKIVFDLYDLLIFGDRNVDINIQQGDTLLINSTNNFISISGAFNRPFTYEFKPNETIRDLIGYALGLTKFANPRKLALKYLDRNSAKLTITEIDVLSDDPLINNFLNPVELVAFLAKSSPEFKVKVTGPIENQGFFDVPNTGLLSDIIGQLRFSSDVYPFMGVLQQGNYSKLFSLIDEDTQEIYLEENSEIFFFDKNDSFLTKSLNRYQEMLNTNAGEVLNYNELKTLMLPDGLSINSLKLINDYQLQINYEEFVIYFPFFGKTNAQEIAEYLGLDLNGIDIKNTGYLSPLDGISKVANLEDLFFKAEKFNSLTFRDFKDTSIRVKVSGEVLLPGTYVLPAQSSLSELYVRTGGLRDSADRQLAIFTRESVRERNLEELESAKQSINETILLNSEGGINPNILTLLNKDINSDSLGRVSGDFSIDSQLNNTFLLEDGDEIYIPKKINIVSVLGEVLNPSTFIFESDMTFKSLINSAGGYKQSALKRSSYIIRSNGKVIKSTNIFQQSIKILPGDTIIVPTDYSADNNFFALLAPVTSTLSNLAFSAAAIDNLRK